MAVSFSGSINISGSLATTGTIIMSGSIASASFASTSVTSSYASNATTASFASNATTSSFATSAVTSSYSTTSSFAASATTASYVDSSQTDATQNLRLAATEARTGSFATTGSNTFLGTQIFTGSVFITSNLVVQGSSSLQNITASAVSVGTNTIILNTNTPILQFGGISVQDSGSTAGRSGSLIWNSVNDHWLNVNPSGSDEGYNSAMVINGPKNTGSLGNEVGLTLNYIPVSQGEDHITDSVIYQSGTSIGIGTTSPILKLHIEGDTYSTTGFYVRNSSDTFLGSLNGVSGMMVNGTSGTNILMSGGNYTMTLTNGGNVGIGSTSPNSLVEIIKSSNSGGGATFPRLSVANSLATQGNGTSTYNFADLRLAAGNSAVEVFLTATYAAGTWEPQGILNVGTNHPLSFKTNNTERMRILAGGNVGIGTTNPGYALDVYSTGASNARVRVIGTTNFSLLQAQNTSGVLYMGIDSSTADGFTLGNYTRVIWSSAAYPLAIAVNDVERMRITSAGKIGIGTTSPYGTFEIASSSQTYAGSPSITFTDTTGDTASNRWIVGNIATTYGTFNIASATTPSGTSWTPRLTILSNGNVGINTSNPSGQLSGTKGISIVDGTNAALGLSNGTNHWLNYLSGTTYRIWNNSVSEVMTIALTGATTFSNSVTATALNLSNTDGYLGTINSTGANGGYFAWQTSGTTIADIGTASQIFGSGGNTTFGINARGSRDLALGANNTERMRITSSGNVGIGLTNPQAILDISHTAGTTNIIRISNGSGNYRWRVDQNFSMVMTNASNSDTFSVSTTGNITAVGAITLNGRTVFSAAALYDNATNGNNVGIGFGPNNILPIDGNGNTSSGTKDLGSSSVRWGTVFTSDLSLSNGIGDYTIVEGENDLFLYNNKQNKVYKFVLAEVDPADATPKKS